MECEVCRKRGLTSTFRLPVRQAPGKEYLIACVRCARHSDVFCGLHGKIHTDLGNRTIVCIDCVSDMMEANSLMADQFMQMVFDAIPSKEAGMLMRAAAGGHFTGHSPACSMLANLACKAVQRQETIEAVVKRIQATRSAECLFQ